MAECVSLTLAVMKQHCQVSFMIVASRHLVTPHSLSALSTQLYGTRGDMEAWEVHLRVITDVVELLPPGDTKREKVEQKERKCPCSCVFMPEWMRIWLWDCAEGSVALLPSPEGWSLEGGQMSVHVWACFPTPKGNALYSDRCLCLTCLSMMSSYLDSCRCLYDLSEVSLNIKMKGNWKCMKMCAELDSDTWLMEAACQKSLSDVMTASTSVDTDVHFLVQY